MREIIIIFVILLVIIGGDVLIQRYLQSTSTEMVSELEELKSETLKTKETDNRTSINNVFEKTEKKWEDTSQIWSMIIPHGELDHVEESIVKTKSSIHDGELEDALQEIETSIFFIKHIREREKILLKNIF